MPYLFSENFQSLDDYSHRPYFATMIRWLKYASFFLTILLPGLFQMGVNGVFWAEPISNFVGGAASFITMLCTVWPALKEEKGLAH